MRKSVFVSLAQILLSLPLVLGLRYLPMHEDETDRYKGELTRVSIVPPGSLNSTTYPRSTPSRMCKQRQILFGIF